MGLDPARLRLLKLSCDRGRARVQTKLATAARRPCSVNRSGSSAMGQVQSQRDGAAKIGNGLPPVAVQSRPDTNLPAQCRTCRQRTHPAFRRCKSVFNYSNSLFYLPRQARPYAAWQSVPAYLHLLARQRRAGLPQSVSESQHSGPNTALQAPATHLPQGPAAVHSASDVQPAAAGAGAGAAVSFLGADEQPIVATQAKSVAMKADLSFIGFLGWPIWPANSDVARPASGENVR